MLFFSLQKYSSKVIFSQNGRDTLVRHDIASCIPWVIRDESVLAKALPLNKLVYMFHHLQCHRHLIFSRHNFADTAGWLIFNAVTQLTNQSFAKYTDLAFLMEQDFLVEPGELL